MPPANGNRTNRKKLFFTKTSNIINHPMKLLNILGLILLLASQASALMLPQSTTNLVDNASVIVEGHVTNIVCRWTTNPRSIVTEVTVLVTDNLLGTNTAAVTFQYPGGRVGDLEQRVSDMPTLTNQQHILVFLRPPDSRLPQTHPQLLSASQGIATITNQRAIKQSFTVVGDSSIVDYNVDLTDLKQRIRDRLATKPR